MLNKKIVECFTLRKTPPKMIKTSISSGADYLFNGK